MRDYFADLKVYRLVGAERAKREQEAGNEVCRVDVVRWTAQLPGSAAVEVKTKTEPKKKHFWEQCPASECHVDGPGEGNCEVNCVEEDMPPSILQTLTVEADGTGASAAFDHAWSVTPAVSFALGSAISAQGSDIGNWILGFVHIPSWLTQGLNHLAHGKLTELGGDLMKCGTEAIPGSLVTINVWGSLRYGYDWAIDCYTYN